MSCSAFPGCAPLVPVEDPQLIAQEVGRLCPGMGDQRFRVRQFQLECVAQERRQLGFDRLSLGPWPGKPKEKIIGIRIASRMILL